MQTTWASSLFHQKKILYPHKLHISSPQASYYFTCSHSQRVVSSIFTIFFSLTIKKPILPSLRVSGQQKLLWALCVTRHIMHKKLCSIPAVNCHHNITAAVTNNRHSWSAQLVSFLHLSPHQNIHTCMAWYAFFFCSTILLACCLSLISFYYSPKFSENFAITLEKPYKKSFLLLCGPYQKEPQHTIRLHLLVRRRHASWPLLLRKNKMKIK